MIASRTSEFVLYVLVTLVLGWSFLHLANSTEQFSNSEAELTDINRLAPTITALRNQPDRVATQSQTERALAKAIEESAAEVGISQSHIARIEPQTPRRVSESSYMEHDTFIRVEDVNLVELAMLSNELQAMVASVGRLYLTSLRIDQPYQRQQDEGESENWNIDLTLTYYVFTPKSPPPSSR